MLWLIILSAIFLLLLSFLFASFLRFQKLKRLILSEEQTLEDDIEKAVMQLLSERQTIKVRLSYFKQVLEKLPVGVVVFNKDYKIVYTNRFANRFLMRGIQEKKEKKILSPIEHSFELSGMVKQCIEACKETFDVNDSESKRSFRITVHHISSDDGKEIMPIAIIEDISEERRLEEFKRYLVSDLSHQLKTPIASMKIAVEALQDYGLLEDREKSSRLLKNLKEDIERLREVLEKILLLSKIQSYTKNELRTEEFNLKNLVEEVVSRLKPQAQQKQLKFELQSGDVMIQADKGLIEEAVLNIVENAVKFSDTEKKIIIRVGQKDRMAFVSITNFGPVIEKEEIPFLFQRFYRSRKGGIKSREGFGLGLSLAKNIIEVHSGSIDVESSEEKGTTFTIWLPVKNF
ncbi:MAG: PAS domain-containing sensor histidine kinase [Actinobacteria bacterium]|nr:PAS domain-containing sensor histidine kinase [Actinomycetota bacterium]